MKRLSGKQGKEDNFSQESPRSNNSGERVNSLEDDELDKKEINSKTDNKNIRSDGYN